MHIIKTFGCTGIFNIVEAFGGHANMPWPVVNLWFTSYVKDIKVTHVHRVQVGDWEEKKKKKMGQWVDLVIKSTHCLPLPKIQRKLKLSFEPQVSLLLPLATASTSSLVISGKKRSLLNCRFDCKIESEICFNPMKHFYGRLQPIPWRKEALNLRWKIESIS